MIHPLFKLLVSEPALLAGHASAYVALASAEAELLATRLRRRALCLVGAAVVAAVALGLTGVAALLAAALPQASMPVAWLLWALPAGLWLLAAALLWSARRVDDTPAWSDLRAQWAADMDLLAEAGDRA